MFLLIIPLCDFQALPDQSNIGLPCSYSMGRLLLKCVQHIDSICKTDGRNKAVSRPVQVSVPLVIPLLGYYVNQNLLQ
jgi:hypothetical protein